MCVTLMKIPWAVRFIGLKLHVQELFNFSSYVPFICFAGAAAYKNLLEAPFMDLLTAESNSANTVPLILLLRLNKNKLKNCCYLH